MSVQGSPRAPSRLRGNEETPCQKKENASAISGGEEGVVIGWEEGCGVVEEALGKDSGPVWRRAGKAEQGERGEGGIISGWEVEGGGGVCGKGGG